MLARGCCDGCISFVVAIYFGLGGGLGGVLRVFDTYH